MSFLQKNVVYSGTPNQINDALTGFITEKYQYTPNLSVGFNTDLWLPIEITIPEDDTPKFKAFWKQLQYDLFIIKDKHDDDSFELGDKLLQLLFGHPIVNYTYMKHDANLYNFIHNDEGIIYISVDETQPLEYADKTIIDEKRKKIETKYERFSLTKSDFVSLENDSFSIVDTRFSREMDFISLEFSYQQNEQVTLLFDYSEDDTFTIEAFASAYCSSHKMVQEVQTLLKQAIDLLHMKLMAFSPVIKSSEERIKMIGYPITYFKGLTKKESAVLSLCRIHGLSYENAKDALGLSNKKNVDNTIQRILGKALNGIAGEEVRNLFPGYFDKVR